MTKRKSSDGAAHADRARLATRLSSDFVMRSLDLLRQMHGGELLTGLIWLAIVQANIAHLDGTALSGEFASVDAVPPDELRRPASVLAIANALGLPYETTRRHVGKLLAQGECRRVSGGVIVPAERFLDPRRKEMITTTYANLRRFNRQLLKAGVDLG